MRIMEPGPVDTTAVWRELHGQLLGFVGRRVRSSEDAEDIVQEVMLRIHRHSAELGHVERVSAWVYRIATNAITDYYRRPSRREQPVGADVDLPHQPPATPESAEGNDPLTELAGCLRPMLERLPAKYREAVTLTELDGMTQTAAAERLGLSTSGMKTRVQRGRRHLKDLLLDCCHVDFDTRGAVMGFDSRDEICPHCVAEDPTSR